MSIASPPPSSCSSIGDIRKLARLGGSVDRASGFGVVYLIATQAKQCHNETKPSYRATDDLMQPRTSMERLLFKEAALPGNKR